MKKVLVLALAVVAMAGCTKDEVISLNQEAIGFDNAFIDNSTRSIDPSITKATLDEFQVYGTTQGNENGAAVVSIFDYVTVEDIDETAGVWNWQYEDNYTQYWIAGNTYNFAALKNVAKNNVTLGNDKMPATVKFTATDGKTDLLYARSAAVLGKATGNGKVAFTFNHLLSKVQFTVKNTMITNTNDNLYQYRVSNVQINQAVATATCTLETSAWTPDAAAAKANFAFGNVVRDDETDAALIGAVGAEDVATSADALLLIPAEYSALNITCTIETLLNESPVDVENFSQNVEITLEPGHAYNFVISKGNPGEKIEFTVTDVNGWDQADKAL